MRVYADMVADLFHWGHVEFLRHAREFGDELVVGVHNDEDCASYKRYPVMTMDERVRMVGTCSYVDEVLPNAPLQVTDEWIDRHGIDLVVHGDDLSDEQLEFWYGVPIARGMFKTVSYTPGISTTEIVRRIVARADELLEP